jgi:hypothetical protein
MPDILRPSSGLYDSRMSSENTGHPNVEDDGTAWVRNGEQQIPRDRPKYPIRIKISRVTSKLMTYMPNSVNGYVKNTVTQVPVFTSVQSVYKTV